LGKRGGNGVGPSKSGSDGATKIPQVAEGVRKGGIGKDADKEDMGSCHRSQGGVQGQQSMSVSTL